MIDENWRTHLMQTYPHLFTRKIEGRMVQSGYPSVEDGWRDIVETAITRINSALNNASPQESIHIAQIKEKLGGLRIYIDGFGTRQSPDLWRTIRAIIDLAEARAACTCEICGKEGRLYTNQGYLTTRCARHGSGFVRVHSDDREMLHYSVSYEGGAKVQSCRRYDRDADTFVDAPLPPDFDSEDL